MSFFVTYMICLLTAACCERTVDYSSLGPNVASDEVAPDCDVPPVINGLIEMLGARDIDVCNLTETVKNISFVMNKLNTTEKAVKAVKQTVQDIVKEDVTKELEDVTNELQEDATKELQHWGKKISHDLTDVGPEGIQSVGQAIGRQKAPQVIFSAAPRVILFVGQAVGGLMDCVLSEIPFVSSFYKLAKKVLLRLSGRGDTAVGGFNKKQLQEIRDIVSSVVNDALEEFGANALGQQLAGFSAKLAEVSGLLETADRETVRNSNDATSMEALLTTDSVLFLGADVLAQLQEFIRQRVEKQDSNGDFCEWPPSKGCYTIAGFLFQYSEIFTTVQANKLHASCLAAGEGLSILADYFKDSIKRQRDNAQKLMDFFSIEQLREHPQRWNMHWVLYYSSPNSFVPPDSSWSKTRSDTMVNFCEMVQCAGLSDPPPVNKIYMIYNRHFDRFIGRGDAVRQERQIDKFRGKGNTLAFGQLKEDFLVENSTRRARYSWKMVQSNTSDGLPGRIVEFMNVLSQEKEGVVEEYLGAMHRPWAVQSWRYVDSYPRNVWQKQEEMSWRLIPRYDKDQNYYFLYNEDFKGALHSAKTAQVRKYVQVDRGLEPSDDGHQWLLIPVEDLQKKFKGTKQPTEREQEATENPPEESQSPKKKRNRRGKKKKKTPTTEKPPWQR